MGEVVRSSLGSETEDEMNSTSYEGSAEVPGTVLSVSLVLFLVCIVSVLSGSRSLAAFNPGAISFERVDHAGSARAASPTV